MRDEIRLRHPKVDFALGECFVELERGVNAVASRATELGLPLAVGFGVSYPQFEDAIKKGIPKDLGEPGFLEPGHHAPKPEEAFKKRLDPAEGGDPELWDGDNGKTSEKRAVLLNSFVVGTLAAAAALGNSHPKVKSDDIQAAIKGVRKVCKRVDRLGELWYYCDY